MSATRLLILGALRFMQPAHGYSVRQELESWQADEWANIAYGSIYFALNKMAEEGLLQEIEPPAETRPGRRPPRISYVVTERGEEEFHRLLREYWWQRKPLIDPLQLAVAFIDQLPPGQVRAVLEHRLLLAQANLTESDHLLASPLMATKPPQVADVLRLNRERVLAEVSWLRRMIERLDPDIADSAYPFKPEPSGWETGDPVAGDP